MLRSLRLAGYSLAPALAQNDSEIGNFTFCPRTKVQIGAGYNRSWGPYWTKCNPSGLFHFLSHYTFCSNKICQNELKFCWRGNFQNGPHIFISSEWSWGLVVLWDKSWLRSCDELFHCGNRIGRFEINPSEHLTRSKRSEKSNRQQLKWKLSQPGAVSQTSHMWKSVKF